MNTLSYCLPLIFALAAALPAEDQPPAPVAAVAEAQPEEEKPADPIAEQRERFATLLNEHPLIAKTAFATRFNQLAQEATQCQTAVHAAENGPKPTLTAATEKLDDTLFKLDQAAEDAELEAPFIEISATLDAQPSPSGRDGHRQRLAEVHARLLAALGKHREAQSAERHLRQEAEQLQLKAEACDQSAEVANQDIEKINEAMGKLDENLSRLERARQQATMRESIVTVLRRIHEAQSEALHYRQEADVIAVQADNAGDQAEVAGEPVDQLREEQNNVVEGITEAIQQAADNHPADNVNL